MAWRVIGQEHGGGDARRRDEPQRAALAGRCARAGSMSTRGNGRGTWGGGQQTPKL